MAVPYNVFHVPDFGRPHELDVFHVKEPSVEDLLYLHKRQEILEANKGAGRSPSNQDKVYHAVGPSPKDVPVRGGMGKARNDPANPDSDVPSEQYGEKTPESFYDGTAHRVYMCSSDEKRRAAATIGEIGTTCSSTPSVPPHLMKHLTAAEAVIAKNRQYGSPIPPAIFRRSPLVLNIGGLTAENNWVVINGQAKMYNLETYVDVLRPMGNLQVSIIIL
jgi:hypothetical protein